MPPAGKKGSGKKSSPVQPFNKNWEADLGKAQFEDTWLACVSLVVGDGPEEEEELVKSLVLSFERPQRKLFSLISWDSTVEKINKLGNPKAKRPELPLFYECTEPAKTLLDAGEEIPIDLVAKLLKFQLLEIKACDQKRREVEQLKSAAQKEKTQPQSDGKGKQKDKKEKKGKGPTPGKGQAASADPSKDKKTKLKRRGEAETPIYIDDEPKDGPQHYILIVGFYHPNLIALLNTIGVHVANVIKLCSKHKELSPEPVELNDQEEEEQSSPAVPAEVPESTRKLNLFWTHLRSVLDSGPPDSKLHDVIQLNYVVPDLTLPFEIPDPQSLVELGNRMFDDVARLIYDCLQWRRQHQHYRDNVRLLSIPTAVTEDAQSVEAHPEPTQQIPRSKRKTKASSLLPIEIKLPPTVSLNVDMCYYHKLLDMVPPEACSVPLILHCMLEQVVVSSEVPVLPLFPSEEEEKTAKGPWLNCDLVSYMLQSFLPLLNTEEEKRHLLDEVLTTVEKEEDKERLKGNYGKANAQRPGDPVLFRYHDERGIRLQNITVTKGCNPAETETTLLKTSPVSKLIQSVAEKRNGDTHWRGMKQQLQHYCTDEGMPWSEVERLFDQSVFEAMPLTTVDQLGVLLNHDETQQTQTIIPWGNPLLYAKQRLQTSRTGESTFPTEDPGNSEHLNREICSRLDLCEIQNWRQRCLFDWYYTEHHSAAVFPQVLQKASEEYCCMDIFRESYANILYVFCHNPMNSHGLSKHFWDEALHTDVKFRKYLEHVAEKIYNWTMEEEVKREEMLKKSQMPPETPKDLECPPAAEESQEPVITKDSLKAWKLEQERLKKEELDKKSKKDAKGKGGDKSDKKGKASAGDKKGKASADKKGKTPAGDKKEKADKRGSSAKSHIDSAISLASSDGEKGDLQTREPDNRFIGYSMDGQLIHVSGCVQQMYTSDGGRVTVENVSFVEGSTLMKVALRKDGHNFYTHVNHVVNKRPKPPSEPQDKKNMELKDGVKVLEPETVKLCSFSAVLRSQIHLSYSFYGATGQYKEILEEEPAKEEIPKASPEEPVAFPSPRSGSRTSRQSFQKSAEPPAEPPAEPSPPLPQPPQPPPPFNSLSLSVPNGLLVQFQLDYTQGESSEYGVLIRQSFPFHCKPGQSLPDKSLSQELYRIITNQGVVIRYLRDGAAEVLFADGSVSFSPAPVLVPDEEKTETSEKKDEPQKRSWQTTTSTGDRIWTTGPTNSVVPTTSLCTFLATDPVTQEVMLTREDLVVTVKSPDGSMIADHADGTRITTLFLVTPPHEEVPDCVTNPEEHEDVCYQEEGMSETSETHKLHQTVSNDKSEEEEEEEEGKEEEEENDSTRERVVIVEKEGNASVVMYPKRRAAHLFLADGTIITGNNQAEYEVFPSRGGFLHIQTDGKCVYTSDLEPNACSPSNRLGVYTMSHTDEVVCDISDKNGNHFQVSEYGQTLLLSTSPVTPTQEEEEKIDNSSTTPDVKHKDYCPRIFLLYEDGSGTELLNSHIVEEELQEAYSDPTIALLKEPLSDRQDEFGITILKPGHQSVWSKWVLRKQNYDITPPNLRNRSDEFHTSEVSPPLGSGTSVALTHRERCASSLAQQRVWSCPRVLEIRELSQHRPFTTAFRDALDSRLKDYIERLIKREVLAEQMKLKELRSDEETAQATDLLSLILSFAELDDESHDSDSRSSGMKTKSASVDYASLYIQGIKASVEQSIASEDTDNLGADDALDKSQLSTARKESRWTERLELHRQEMSEERSCKEALRRKSSVPYFHPENFQIYQNLLQCHRPHIKSTSQDLPLPTKVDSAEKSTSVDGMEPDMKDASTQSTPQPYNTQVPPSESRAEESERTSERRHSDLPKHSPVIGESSLKSPSRHFKSVQVDVTGQPRSSKVRLPGYLRVSKPRSVPNQRFLTVEEPVKRYCRISTLTDPGAQMKGFLLDPSRVDFGTQQEGTYATITVAMKNLGIDPSRFIVKQPSPSTGLRVIYSPGPVPSGLQAELQVQLFSTCDATEPKKYISVDIAIFTETDILYLPVTAEMFCGEVHVCVQTGGGRVHLLSQLARKSHGGAFSPLMYSQATLAAHGPQYDLRLIPDSSLD